MLKSKHFFYIFVLLGLCTLPLGAAYLFSEYYLDLFTKILILGIMLLGFDILAGYTGLVSLGHAMFFGIGGYCAAFLINNGITNLVVVLIFTLLVTTIVGLIIGYFSTQTRDIFFVFLTLAFSQFFYLAAFNLTGITGGDNGMTVDAATIGVPAIWASEITMPFFFYYIVLFFFICTYLICLKVIRSPFGKILVAIRENEERVNYLGFNTRNVKIKSYMISVYFASIAGVLNGIYQNFVSPGMLSWHLSGDLVLMTVLGGTGTLIGPVLGGAIITILGDELSSLTENWMIFIGAFFVLTIIFAPNGIMGLLKGIRRTDESAA